MIQILTDTEEEITRLLIEIGLKTNEARVLVVFFRGSEQTSRDIERITDLRQPEVSVAITGLSKRKWVYVSNLITENKGRPVKLFNLTEPVDEILDELRDVVCSGHDNQGILLARIREILHKE